MPEDVPEGTYMYQANAYCTYVHVYAYMTLHPATSAIYILFTTPLVILIFNMVKGTAKIKLVRLPYKPFICLSYLDLYCIAQRQV